MHQTSAFEVEVICGDATEIELDFDCEVFLFYLYNPFDSQILDEFLTKISNKKAVIIYNSPIHKNILIDKGFKEYFEKESWHPNANFTIFSNISPTQSVLYSNKNKIEIFGGKAVIKPNKFGIWQFKMWIGKDIIHIVNQNIDLSI